MYINRHILPYLHRMKKQFRVLLIIGSRQVGKSTLLKEKLLPDYGYVTLDDFTELGLAQKDPALFFKNHPLPVIVDEVQRVPDLFLQIKLLAAGELVNLFVDNGLLHEVSNQQRNRAFAFTEYLDLFIK